MKTIPTPGATTAPTPGTRPPAVHGRAGGRAGLRIGSMCSGYGGLDMAVQQVFGGDIAWHAELDPDASKVLAHRYPGVPNLGDITTVQWQDAPRVDIVCAGFPCQDISYAGRGDGIQEGNRSGLWHTIANAIGALRPRLIVLENVRAIVVRRPGLDVVLADLARLGFDAEWTCVRASDVGAPHQRNRWFLRAWRATTAASTHEVGARRRQGPGGLADAPRADEGQTRHRNRNAASPDPGDAPTDTASERHRDARPARVGGMATAAVPGSSADTQGHRRDQGRPEPARQLGRSDASLGGTPAPANADSNAVREQPVTQPGCGSTAVAGLPRPEASADDADGPVWEWGPYGPAIHRWERITGWAAPAPTKPRRTGERLSPAFVEWLMGLPAGHVTDVPGISLNAQLRLLGNGVVPQQAAAALTDLAVSS